MDDDTPGGRMDPGELQTVREYLGLTTESLAGMLGVRPDTLRRWESGREPIPHRVREEVEEIEEHTARAVEEIVAALRDARDPTVRVYRTDQGLHRARPDLAHLPARWWRHVVYRAVEQVPGVAIVSGRGPATEGPSGEWLAETEFGLIRAFRESGKWSVAPLDSGPNSGANSGGHATPEEALDAGARDLHRQLDARGRRRA